MLQFVILSLVIAYSNLGAATDYIPLKEIGNNKCTYIKPSKVEAKKEMYEGRWYTAKIYTTSDQIFHDKCEAWDVFFDKKGHVHSFLHIEDTQSPQLTIDIEEEISTLKDAKTGQYIEFANENITVMDVLYYVDKDLLVVYEEGCEHKVITRKDMVILLRNIADFSKHEDQIKKFAKEFKDNGGKPGILMKHNDCKYHKKLVKSELKQLH